jgi:hypothetical protein
MGLYDGPVGLARSDACFLSLSLGFQRHGVLTRKDRGVQQSDSTDEQQDGSDDARTRWP